MDAVETHLPCSDAAPARARAFLRDTLATWAVDGASSVAEVLATELVSNVVRHVRAPMTLRVVLVDACLRVEVDDPSPELPVPRLPREVDVDGRGLLLVESLARRWGVTPHDREGKTVWFELDATH